jgi:hypothetical protein
MTSAVAMALALIASGCAAGEVGGNEPPTTAMTSTSTTEAAPDAGTVAPTTVADTSTTTSTEPPSSESTELVARLAAAPVVSGRMEGSTEITGLDTGTGIADASIAFATAFDAATGDGSILIDFSGFAAAFDAQGTGTDPDDPLAGLASSLAAPMEFRQVGDRVYARTPLFGAMFGIDTEWLSMPADDGRDFASGFEMVPSDPSVVLDAYEGADATVDDLGSESVNGVEATHYLVTFDTTAMVAQMSPEERAEFEASGVFADGTVPLDLWISSEGHVVRMILDIAGSTIEGANDEGFERMLVRYDAYDINGDVRIEAPAASSVTEVESLGLGDMTFDFGA